MLTAEAFFKELQRLLSANGKRPNRNVNCENCDWGNQLYHCKNMTYCFDCLRSSDSIYLFNIDMSVCCVDCDYTEESELCYECVDVRKGFNCNFSQDCFSVRDCDYCVRCLNGHNLFGCIDLQNKSYCLFNRQLTEAEYKEQVKKYRSLPQEKVLQMVEEVKKRFPVTQTHGRDNENSPYGDYSSNCRNSYMCFDSTKNDSCGYMYEAGGHNNCYDATFSGESELSYEFIDSVNLFNCNFALFSGYCNDCSYIFDCGHCSNCLGCVNIGHRKYCILNRQFTKEEYEKIAPQILSELKAKNLGWGNLVF